MPASQTQIALYNVALGLVGDAFATGTTDDSREVRACNRMYEPSRDFILGSHFWNCAMRRNASLARVSDQPLWGYTYAYQLPSDCLRVKLVEANDDWKLEGSTIVTDYDSCAIVYTARITDVSKFSPTLFQAVATHLAASICYGLTRSATLAESLERRWRDLLASAMFLDANEQQGDGTQVDYTEQWRRVGVHEGNVEQRG